MDSGALQTRRINTERGRAGLSLLGDSLQPQTHVGFQRLLLASPRTFLDLSIPDQAGEILTCETESQATNRNPRTPKSPPIALAQHRNRFHCLSSALRLEVSNYGLKQQDSNG